MTANERKQRERDRKREKKLKLIQIWVLPDEEEKARRIETRSIKRSGYTAE